MSIWIRLVAVGACLWPFGSAWAQDFNEYVLKAVKYLAADHSNGGYDINQAFTHDIDYGGKGTIKASGPPRTMCVAAVSEVMIQATKIYADEKKDPSVFDKIPIKAWTFGNVVSLRANVFMYGETGSHGTADALSRLGLGEQLQFKDLKAGDFINLNRTTKFGHAVVFLGYVDNNLNDTTTYDPATVIGFRYFSAQGGSDNGFAYRNAYFEGQCPTKPGVKPDCHVIQSSNPIIFNVGRMWSPNRWNYLGASADISRRTRSVLEGANPGATKGAIDLMFEQTMDRELTWTGDEARFFSNQLPD